MAESELLTPAYGAALFGGHPTPDTRWAPAGTRWAVRTRGGHRRFRASDIHRSLAEVQELPL